MIRIACASLVAGCLVLLGGCAGSGNAAGVAKAKDAYFAAWTKKDGEAFTTARLAKVIATDEDFFSIDGVAPTPTLTGWKAYESTWAGGMNQFKSAQLIEVSTHRTWVGDDMAATASACRVTGVLGDGTKLDMPANVTLVFKHVDGEWRIVHENMNVPPPKH